MLACIASVGLSATTKPQKKHTVVVVSLDGFPAYALDDPRLPIPTLRKLAREGVAAARIFEAIRDRYAPALLRATEACRVAAG